MFVFMMLCLLAVVIVFLSILMFSHHSLDFLVVRRRTSSSGDLLRKLNGVFYDGNELGGMADWNLPDLKEKFFDPTGILVDSSVMPKENDAFLQEASIWAKTVLENPPKHVFYPFGIDVVNCLGVFPDANTYVVMTVWPLPTVRAIKECGDKCQLVGKQLSVAANRDLETEGFVTTQTLKDLSSANSQVGGLPALFASIVRAKGKVIHVEDSFLSSESALTCLKIYASFDSDFSSEKQCVIIACGSLDESNEKQRYTVRSILKPLQPISLLMRASNYVLFPDVNPRVDHVSLTHFKAMLLALSSTIVTDDSGIPLTVLAKHTHDLRLYGEYRGLGEPKLAYLTGVSATVLKSLFQPDLANMNSQGSLSFHFGYRTVIGPAQGRIANTAADGAAISGEVFVRRSDFKGSHVIVALKQHLI